MGFLSFAYPGISGSCNGRSKERHPKIGAEFGCLAHGSVHGALRLDRRSFLRGLARMGIGPGNRDWSLVGDFDDRRGGSRLGQQALQFAAIKAFALRLRLQRVTNFFSSPYGKRRQFFDQRPQAGLPNVGANSQLHRRQLVSRPNSNPD